MAKQYGSLLNSKWQVITDNEGQKKTPYARILIRPTLSELGRRYAREFLKTVTAPDGTPFTDEELGVLREEIAGHWLAGVKFIQEHPDRITVKLTKSPESARTSQDSGPVLF